MLQSAKSPPAKYAHRDKVEGNETNYILEAAIWFKVLLQLYERRFLRIAGVLNRDFSDFSDLCVDFWTNSLPSAKW